jgi:hypothetical protein
MMCLKFLSFRDATSGISSGKEENNYRCNSVIWDQHSRSKQFALCTPLQVTARLYSTNFNFASFYFSIRLRHVFALVVFAKIKSAAGRINLDNGVQPSKGKMLPWVLPVVQIEIPCICALCLDWVESPMETHWTSASYPAPVSCLLPHSSPLGTSITS